MSDHSNVELADKIRALAATPDLASLPKETLEALAARASRVVCRTDEVLLHEGDVGTDLFILTSGVLTVEVGNGTEVGRVRTGDLVGEMQLLTGGERTATLRASVDTELLRVSKADFTEVAARHASLREHLAELVRRRFRRHALRAAIERRFKSSDEAVLEALIRVVQWRSISRGDILVRQGEPSDSMYFLLFGRVEAISFEEGTGRETHIGDVLPGESIGETAIIDGETRKATIRAVRDSEVAEIRRDSLLEITNRFPQLMLRILEVVVSRQTKSDSKKRRGGVIAIVPLSQDRQVSDAVARIRKALEGEVRSAVVDQETVVRRFGATDADSLGLSLWLETLDHNHELLVVIAGTDPGWRSRCVAMADEVVLVADADSDPLPRVEERSLFQSHAARLRRTLVLVQKSGQPKNTARWLNPRKIDQVLHVRPQRTDDFQRVCRFLTGRAIGVVISGGAARGFAGAGLLKALHENGVPIDMVGGVSSGAVVAAFYALTENPDDFQRDARKFATKLVPTPTLPVVSFLGPQRLIEGMRSIFLDRGIEDLMIPTLFVSSNLTRAEQRVSTRGPVCDHLYASSALPPLFPPMVLDGDLHADGAFVNNIPIAEVKEAVRGGPVIALDVTPSIEFEHNTPTPKGMSGWQVAVDWVTKRNPAAPNLFDVLMRSQLVHHVALMRRVQSMADLYMRPDLGAFGFSEYWKLDAIVKAGHDSTVEDVRKFWAAHRAAENRPKT